jgi:hypothetical protein
MTREQAIMAVRVYAAWQYDTDINVWSVTSREKYIERYIDSVKDLPDTFLISIGQTALDAMQNPVGDLVKQLRTLQAL